MSVAFKSIPYRTLLRHLHDFSCSKRCPFGCPLSRQGRALGPLDGAVSKSRRPTRTTGHQARENKRAMCSGLVHRRASGEMNVLPDRCSKRPVRSRGGCEVMLHGSSCSGPDRHHDGLVCVSVMHVGFTVPISERLTSDGSLGAAMSTTSSMVTDTRGSLPRRRMDSWRDRLPIRPGEEGEK